MPSSYLIVQAPEIATGDLKALAKLIGASSIEAIDGGSCQAFRIGPVAQMNAASAVSAYCEAARLDFGLVPDEARLSRVGLVAMDMDSTLITIECVDEIADMQGIKPQIAAITESAMRGEIDFAQSLRRRVALLAGLDVSALQRVYDERLRLSPGAERMLRAFQAAGAKTLLVSGGFDFFTDRLKARLRFGDTVSNTLEVEAGKLTGRVVGHIVDAEVKKARLLTHRSRLAADQNLVVAIGDGANDLPMLAAADVSIAYRAKPVVRAQATYAINFCGLDAVLPLFN